MNGSDITLAVLIIIIFSLLQIFNVLAIGIKNIQNNWPLYRCDPMILPIASLFGHDTEKNFSYCISNINMSFMGYILDPIYYVLNSINNLGSGFGNTFNNFRSAHNNMRNNIIDSILNVFSIFLNILIEFQKIIIKLKDTLAKLVGVMTVLMFTVSGVEDTLTSGWNGPIGGFIRAVSSF